MGGHGMGCTHTVKCVTENGRKKLIFQREKLDTFDKQQQKIPVLLMVVLRFLIAYVVPSIAQYYSTPVFFRCDEVVDESLDILLHSSKITLSNSRTHNEGIDLAVIFHLTCSIGSKLGEPGGYSLRSIVYVSSMFSTSLAV